MIHSGNGHAKSPTVTRSTSRARARRLHTLDEAQPGRKASLSRIFSDLGQRSQDETPRSRRRASARRSIESPQPDTFYRLSGSFHRSVSVLGTAAKPARPPAQELRAPQQYAVCKLPQAAPRAAAEYRRDTRAGPSQT